MVHQIANRTLDRVMNHALLKNKVDLEQDRMTLKNPNLLGAKHVADLTRSVAVGVSGRIGRKRETNSTTRRSLSKSTAILAASQRHSLTWQQLPRETSHPNNYGRTPSSETSACLGSSPVYGMSSIPRKLTTTKITQFFRKLDKHMAAPVDDKSIWRVTQARDDFEPNASAPIMRTQNLQHLAGVMTDWFTNPPAKL
jgi:hypothetical protein